MVPEPQPAPREPTPPPPPPPPPPTTTPTENGKEESKDGEDEKEDVSHVSQKSMEEIAYEEQAAIVAKQLRDEEKHLSGVILPPAEHKKTSDFITGIFDTKVHKVGRRPSLLTRYNPDSTTNRFVTLYEVHVRVQTISWLCFQESVEFVRDH
jgi:hypothetical protein